MYLIDQKEFHYLNGSLMAQTSRSTDFIEPQVILLAVSSSLKKKKIIYFQDMMNQGNHFHSEWEYSGHKQEGLEQPQHDPYQEKH